MFTENRWFTWQLWRCVCKSVEARCGIFVLQTNIVFLVGSRAVLRLMWANKAYSRPSLYFVHDFIAILLNTTCRGSHKLQNCFKGECPSFWLFAAHVSLTWSGFPPSISESHEGRISYFLKCLIQRPKVPSKVSLVLTWFPPP